MHSDQVARTPLTRKCGGEVERTAVAQLRYCVRLQGETNPNLAGIPNFEKHPAEDADD